MGPLAMLALGISASDVLTGKDRVGGFPTRGPCPPLCFLMSHRVWGAAPVDHPLGARNPFRDALHLSRPRGQRRSTPEGARLRDDDPGRQRDQARAVLVAGAVLR